jgi:hypothetical protein
VSLLVGEFTVGENALHHDQGFKSTKEEKGQNLEFFQICFYKAQGAKAS